MTLNQIRIARPVSDLLLCSNMYCCGLGLEQIAQFADRDGFSEVMIGRRDLSCILNSPTAIIIQWHLSGHLCYFYAFLLIPIYF